MENEVEVGDYTFDSHVYGGIVHAFVKINAKIQCFFRIMPFLCKKKGYNL